MSFLKSSNKSSALRGLARHATLLGAVQDEMPHGQTHNGKTRQESRQVTRRSNTILPVENVARSSG